jgi:D-methionine transport system ATP-binding protein
MAILSIEHLSKSFGNTVVLDDVSLTIEKGDIFGILGLSGAGKSTLVRCINGLERPTSGQVLYNDKVISSAAIVPDGKTRQKIAMIFQSFGLLEQRNALENVHLAFELLHEDDKDRSQSRELLKKVGLSDKEKNYPAELSGGQKQRVAIARALALKPEILLCDEATSALDVETTDEILELIKGLNKDLGLTVIIISHQMSVLEDVCNKVAILDKAKIVEEGLLSDVFLNPQTPIAKRLIYTGHVATKLDDDHYIRLLFNGDVDSPLISNIVEDCSILVSIYFADTKVIEGKVYGQMIIKLPYYKKDIAKLEKYLTLKKVDYKEVGKDELR